MIRVNLLPHRELRRAQRRRDFWVMAFLAFGAAVVIVFFVGFIIGGYKDNQQRRNDFIKAENSKLDDQIKEIASLRQEIDALRARQQAVENLQGDRNLPVHLFDELVKQIPEGVYLTGLKQDGLKFTISGLAQSNDRISELLRNLGNNSPWLQSPELLEIHAVSAGKENRRLNSFTINALLKRPENKDTKSGDTAKPAAATPAKP
jgi:type IV pilus assembly protein PilN